MRLVVATIDDPSLLWNALVVIPLVVAGMWLILFAMSTPVRQRHRLLTELNPDAVHVHATEVGPSLDTLSRLGFSNEELKAGRISSASLLFTDDSLEIWIGGKAPHLVARLPRANFTGIKHARKTVALVNPTVSVSLDYLLAGGSTEFVFVPSHAMGRPLRSRQVHELIPSIRAWVGNKHVAL